MRQGKVKWYNAKKCYGFVTPLTPNEQESIEDVFIHSTSLKDAGVRFLNENDLIEFDEEVRNGKLSVTTMKLISRDEESARRFQERRSEFRGHGGGDRRGGDRRGDHRGGDREDGDKRSGWAFWKK